MIENATAEIAHTPAARPSTPSEKFTTFISTTSPSTVTGPPRSPSSTRCTNGSVNVSTFTPEVTSTTAAAICPASLISRVQVEDVVERADDRDQRRGGEDALGALVVGQEDQPRDERAAEDREPAEQRRRLAREPALLDVVDRADPAREARRERCQRGRHREGDQRGEDGLRHHDRAPRIAGCADATTSIPVDFP